MSLLAEHDMNMERLSREWKESQETFAFLDWIKVRGFALMKFVIRNGMEFSARMWKVGRNLLPAKLGLK